MLESLFLQLLNMSFTAGTVILSVMAARLVLKKAPKSYAYVLWSAALFRLVCPFSLESAWSLLPTKAAPITQGIARMAQPEIDTGIAAIDRFVNAALPPATPHASANPLQIWLSVGSLVWVAGIAVLLVYSAFTLRKLQHRLRGAAHVEGNIYLSGSIDTAFVLGVFRPRIYLPANLSPKEREYILLHEQTHIRRFDHIAKVLSFLVACAHWFNPLVWCAFFLSARDMEMSCDEAVIKKLGSDVKRDYSASLLTLATGRRVPGAAPLAFGEGDTKGRIKNVLNYRRPAFWVMAAAAVAVLCAVIGLMANPKTNVSANPEADGLWQGRTQYIGDNFAVGKIITALSFPEELEVDGFELYTAEPAYGVDIRFKTDTETRNFYTGALHEVPLQRGAIVLFSLIENAEHIVFTLDDGQNPYSVDYTREWAEAFMGGDGLFARTKTKEGLADLLEEVSVKISDSLEEDIERYQQGTGQKNLTFFVKPDEPPEVIGHTAAVIWLKSLMSSEGREVPAESRISDYAIVDVSVIVGTPREGEKWEDMKYHYVVRVNYNITTATEEYFAPGDGVAGKGTFEGLFRELCVRAPQGNSQFEIVSVGTGGGEKIFAP